MIPYQTNLEYLQDEFRCLDLLLARAVEQFRVQRDRNIPTEFQGFYISDAEVDRLMGGERDTTEQSWDETEHKVTHLREEIEQRVKVSLQAGVSLRLTQLKQKFCLSRFETDLLLLALAPELDLRYQKLYAYLQDNVERKRPSVELALRLFCYSLKERVQAREVFAESSPLLGTPLLKLHEEPTERPAPLLSRGLQLEGRIVEFLLGSDRMDRRLTTPLPIVRWLVPQISLQDLLLPHSVKIVLSRLIKLTQVESSWLCLLHGSAGTGKKTCAEALCRVWGCSLLVVDLLELLKSDLPYSMLFQVAWREARLYGNPLYLNGWQALRVEDPRHSAVIILLESVINQFPGVVFLGSRSPWQPTSSYNYRFINIEIPLPDESLRRQLWNRQIQQIDPMGTDLDLTYLANAFRFSGGQIRQALSHATSQAQLRQGNPYQLTLEDLLAGCRLVSRRQLISFAQRIEPKRRWSDLVLPKNILTQLQEFCQQIRYRMQVYGDWGFSDKLSLGKGLIALFTGVSGTGKTLSTEVLATETGLDLYRVDLASVVSKYIGETEKNLSQVFEDAQISNAILFFDEADALFGKRSDVKDAHDRYANIEVNYLLQRVEMYEGAIILASNLSKNIDEAFLRRLHFKIEFPFPNENLRLAIWKRIFPNQAPLASDIDFEFLASKFKITGGNIKNVVLGAAFRAAEEDCDIKMEHIILALKREYQKLGKVCDKKEFGSYYDLVR